MSTDIEKIITTANSAEEAMRWLMFASMLMYKIDEAVKNAKIEE